MIRLLTQTLPDCACLLHACLDVLLEWGVGAVTTVTSSTVLTLLSVDDKETGDILRMRWSSLLKLTLGLETCEELCIIVLDSSRLE